MISDRPTLVLQLSTVVRTSLQQPVVWYCYVFASTNSWSSRVWSSLNKLMIKLTHRVFWCISIRSTVLFLEKQQLEELPIQNKHTKKLGHFLLQMHLMGRLMLIFWLLFSVLIWAECRKENVSDLIWLSLSSLLDILSLWTPLKKNTSQQ